MQRKQFRFVLAPQLCNHIDMLLLQLHDTSTQFRRFRVMFRRNLRRVRSVGATCELNFLNLALKVDDFALQLSDLRFQ